MKQHHGAGYAPSQQHSKSSNWLAGASLGLLVLTLVFVTGGFVSYHLGVSASQQTIAASSSAMDIVILPKSTRELLAASRTETAATVQTADEETGAEIVKWTGPRVKPAAPSSQPETRIARAVTRSIDMNAVWLAETDYVGFALERDFTGGKEPLFTRYQPALIEPAPENEIDAVFLARGETLSEALTRAGIRALDREAAIGALAGEMNLRRLQPGQKLLIHSAAPARTAFQEAAFQHLDLAEEDRGLVSLTVDKDPLHRAEVTYNHHEGFTGKTLTAQTTTHYAAISGEITDSLFASAERAGAPRDVVAKLANLFLFDIDFQREIRRGDRFEAVYEVIYDDQGRIVSYGDVVYGRMSWLHKSREKGYYRFAESGKTQWFNEEGKSARRLLMKTPIEGARITSGFGRRRHPVLGYTKQHKGVDFGARRGTPIMAAGDGTIERANRFGSYGNYIKIRHANGYQTAYAHLKGFAKGIRKGKRVRQGQIIGYVGTTGRSTGPHLHYEVLRNKKQINPMRIKVATGKTLSGETLDEFMVERDWIDGLRVPVRSDLQLASN